MEIAYTTASDLSQGIAISTSGGQAADSAATIFTFARAIPTVSRAEKC